MQGLYEELLTRALARPCREFFFNWKNDCNLCGFIIIIIIIICSSIIYQCYSHEGCYEFW